MASPQLQMTPLQLPAAGYSCNAGQQQSAAPSIPITPADRPTVSIRHNESTASALRCTMMKHDLALSLLDWLASELLTSCDSETGILIAQMMQCMGVQEAWSCLSKGPLQRAALPRRLPSDTIATGRMFECR